MKLVFERLSKYALTSCSCASWISSLHAEIFNQTVKSQTVVITILAQLQEILTSFRDEVRMNMKSKVSKICSHENRSFELLLRDDCIDLLPYLRLFEVSKGSDSFAERSKTRACETGRVCSISLPVMFINFVLDAPIDEPFDVFSRFEVFFYFFLSFSLLLFYVLIGLSFQIDLVHDSADGLILFDIRSELVFRSKRKVIFQEIKLSNLFAFIIFGILNSDDILRFKRIICDSSNFTCNQIEKVLFFFVELLNRLVGVDIARSFDAYYVSIFSEDLITDWILVLFFLVLGPVHFDQLADAQRTTSNWTSFVFFDKVSNVYAFKYVSLYCADRVSER